MKSLAVRDSESDIEDVEDRNMVRRRAILQEAKTNRFHTFDSKGFPMSPPV